MINVAECTCAMEAEPSGFHQFEQTFLYKNSRILHPSTAQISAEIQRLYIRTQFCQFITVVGFLEHIRRMGKEFDQFYVK